MTVSAVGGSTSVHAVVDSGSPVTVADPEFLLLAGIDIARDEPVMELTLGLAASFRRVPVFSVDLLLVPPRDSEASPRRWTLAIAAQPGWRLPCGVLLGQRGWFDQNPTTIDATDTTVHLPT